MLIQKKSLRYLLFLCVIFQSCITSQQANLLQGVSGKIDQPITYSNSNSVYRIQPNDVLSIKFKAKGDAELADPYNLFGSNQLVTENNPSTNFINGYSVDETGNIYLPEMGELKVSGLSVEEVRKMVQEKIQPLLTGATAFVSLVSFKISVLGEVQVPGYFYVYNNQATLLDAISLSGGLKEFADPRRIKLIRQNSKITEAVIVDLTSKSILESPYYFLQPNDVVVINPLEVKFKRSNQQNLNIFNTVFAGVSTAITLILLFRDRS